MVIHGRLFPENLFSLGRLERFISACDFDVGAGRWGAGATRLSPTSKSQAEINPSKRPRENKFSGNNLP